MADVLSGLGGITTILRKKGIWNNQNPIDFMQSRNIFEFTGTVIELISFSDDRPQVVDIEFVNKSKQEEFELMDFFNNCEGMLKKFWFQPPQSMFTFLKDLVSGSSSITVANNGIKESWRGFERIYIELSDGDLLTYNITDIQDGENEDELFVLIDTPLDRDVFISDVRLFGFLLLVRFNADFLEFEKLTQQSSLVKTQMLELVKEYPS